MSRSCPSCQAPLTPKSKFCPACGTATPLQEPATTTGATGAATETSSSPAATTASESAVRPVPTMAPAAPAPEPTAPAAPEARGWENPSAAPAMVSATEALASPAGDDQPFALFANFNHALVAGNVSTIGLRLANRGVTAIENTEIYLSSRGLAGEATLRVRRLAPGARSDLLVEVEAARAGNFILQVAATGESAGQRFSFRGQRPLRIYKAPDNANVVINISDINSNTGAGANQGLGAEYGDVQISNLIEKGAIKTVNDLLDLELPDNFQPIELELDYELSQLGTGPRDGGGAGQLRIPPAFLAAVQPASICQLDPVGGEAPLPFRLIARPQFRLGRGRTDADFVAWVLPRNPSNDEKSKRVSKVQAIAELAAEGIIIRDNASSNGTLFDGVPLDQNGTKLPRQGRLLLAGAVEVDFDRLAPASETFPSIANLRQWSGPDGAPLPQRGAVRFEVVAAEPQPLNAVWLLSDAACGTSRSAAIVLPDPGLAEIQARFHFFRGCFWIECIAGNSGLQVDQTTLRAGEIVPLTTGMQLRLGRNTFRLKLEA